ncbi:MAG: hypoxanthine-guanine phosphoribosyltransferase [Burkholderiales bacterium]|nr:hypoxanthine-guanine phosphoribosyltransferase [Burkholderiales bacterium]
MEPAQAWKVLESAERLCDERAVGEAIARLGIEIGAALAPHNPLVLVVMRGALYFAGQLLPALRFPLELDYVHLSRYGDRLTGGELRWLVEPGENVRGRHVLVLDDILDAGDTLAAVRSRVLELGALSCTIAVLLDKRTGRDKPVHADFVGVEIANRYVFGCGLDVAGAWRNLPELYAVRQT